MRRPDDPRRADEPYELPVSGSLRLARWSTALAGLSALAAGIIGFRYGQQSLYQTHELLTVQVYGQDLVVLILVVPLLAGAVFLTRKGSARGLFVWAGALVYLAYWYHFLLGGIDFGPMYLLHLTLVGSSLFALGVLGARLDVERLAHRFEARMPARTIGAFMAIAAAVFATAGIVDMVDLLRDRALIDVATRGAYSADFTIMLPATLVAGVLLWRHASWGYVLAGPLLINAALSATTLLVAIVRLIREGIALNTVAVALLAATLVLSGAAAIYLRGVRVSSGKPVRSFL
jgi:hypothetical protein